MSKFESNESRLNEWTDVLSHLYGLWAVGVAIAALASQDPVLIARLGLLVVALATLLHGRRYLREIRRSDAVYGWRRTTVYLLRRITLFLVGVILLGIIGFLDVTAASFPGWLTGVSG